MRKKSVYKKAEKHTLMEKCAPLFNMKLLDLDSIELSKKEFISKKLVDHKSPDVFLEIFSEYLLKLNVEESEKYDH
ncbi:hypothetical protein TNCT_725741 [Trichonephila clavata]|uniref:Uncharacterized protein n=1 Tax=Trichonephila clavata TaxID=2740835 RepID=A0A8X6KBB7_TRICU|nr:hypothetical protein TNCT_725741 [Trichonephila clavata]